MAVKAAIQVARPSLEKFFLAQAPVAPPSNTRFATVDRPPGEEFRPNLRVVNSLSYNENGNLVLKPGDYVIPVMTYCMDSSGSSYDGHSYALSRLAGTMAHVIREINLKASPRFSAHDIQILSWSLQNGLNYEELTSESRRIVDEVIPELNAELKQSFINKLSETWNQLADRSRGLIPSFESATDEFLEEFGETGHAIIKIRKFRQLLKNSGNDYSRLRDLIHLPGRSSDAKQLWSKISENVYARFTTKGHFQEVGQIEIRVLAANPGRKVNSLEPSDLEIDPSSWVGDPGSSAIQPLSFSALYGFAGVTVLPEIAVNPIWMGMLLGAVLASQPVDWDAFYEMSKLAQGTKTPEIRRMVERGTGTLHKAHDDLEKPARELGVIDRKTKKVPGDENKPSRNYEKPGGNEALKKDFDKFPGETTSPEPGVDMKTLPNGGKVVKRLVSRAGEVPTLEIQPPKTGNKVDDRRRIKVRYP